MQKLWYAIYTKSRNEKRVAELLTKQGIENYLPLMKKIRIWSDRKKSVEMPLFNSYIFVHIDEKEYYECIKVQGVVKFVSFERKRVSIPDYQIEAIKKYVETGEELIPNEGEYTPGKKVRVIRGGMKGLEGRLTEVLGKQRVKVEIESIQQSLFLQIPLGSLEIIGEARDEEVRYW
ncbi:MAG: UpxY family transcription antiterminator [Bacteroidales bacterium]|nr:UpxY family transcription antiterminator [Bacteroidales bacterium]